MSTEEAVQLGRLAIYHATHKDSASGGMVRVYHVIEGGWEKVIEGDDVSTMHYEIAQKKGLKGDGNETGMEYFNA